MQSIKKLVLLTVAAAISFLIYVKSARGGSEQQEEEELGQSISSLSSMQQLNLRYEDGFLTLQSYFEFLDRSFSIVRKKVIKTVLDYRTNRRNILPQNISGWLQTFLEGEKKINELINQNQKSAWEICCPQHNLNTFLLKFYEKGFSTNILDKKREQRIPKSKRQKVNPRLFLTTSANILKQRIDDFREMVILFMKLGIQRIMLLTAIRTLLWDFVYLSTQIQQQHLSAQYELGAEQIEAASKITDQTKYLLNMALRKK